MIGKKCFFNLFEKCVTITYNDLQLQACKQVRNNANILRVAEDTF